MKTVTEISSILYRICFISTVFVAPLHNFLVGEAKLESYLEQNPPFEKNISKARIGLIEPKNHLLEAITEEGDKVFYLNFDINIF